MNDVLDQALSNPALTTIASAAAAAVVVLWVVAAWWAYADATRRTDSTPAALLVTAWIIVSTPLLLPFSLASYVLVRPQQTAAQQRTRQLAAALVDQLGEAVEDTSCASCGAAVDPEWQRCPTCATWLAAPCASCGGWSDRALAVCPFCGAEERAEPVVQPRETTTISRRRRGRRSARPAAPGAILSSRPPRRAASHDARTLAPAGAQ